MANSEVPPFFFKARQDSKRAREEESAAPSAACEPKLASGSTTFSRKRPASVCSQDEGTAALPSKKLSRAEEERLAIAEVLGIRPAPRLTKSHKARQPRKKALTQTFLDLGQANFAFTTCKDCGMIYAKGVKEDNKLHTVFHKSCEEGVQIRDWQGSPEISTTKEGGCIYCVAIGDSQGTWTKAARVCNLVENQLGMPDGHLLAKPCKVFMMVNARKRVTGCLVAEGPTTACPAVLDKTAAGAAASSATESRASAAKPRTEPANSFATSAPRAKPQTAAKAGASVPAASRKAARGQRRTASALLAVDERRRREAVCGVKGVWVSLSARRSGVASDLLDAARHHAVKGYVVPKAEIAFSQPTEDGTQLAHAYTGSSEFLVY